MILDDIVKARRIQLKREQENLSLEDIKKALDEKIKGNRHFSLTSKLQEGKLTLIAEVKKASPSKGVIKEGLEPLKTAIIYQNDGAGAISVLTEENFFQGSNRFLEIISGNVDLPVLRKDFIIDPYQIYHSKYLGASVILLIAAILDDRQLKEYLEVAKSLGLEVITEVHTEEELVRAIAAGADIIGINNRNLKTFEVSLDNTRKLKALVPPDKLVVSESGIGTRQDIELLKDMGINGVLIGETLIKSDDIESKIRELGL